MSDDTKKKSAVDAPRRNVFMMDPDDIVIVGIDTGDTDKHPLWDPRIHLPIDPLLVANIRHYGVLEPIDTTKDGERLLVVDGRRRVLHARAAKRIQLEAGEEVVKVPVMIRKGDDAHLFGVSRAHNAMRTGDGPLTNARNAQRMIDMGSSEAQVALTFGVTPQAVKNWLALLGLHTDVLAAVKAEQLTPTAAIQLAVLPRAEQAEVVSELAVADEKPTVEAVKRRVGARTGKGPGNAPKDKIERAVAILTKYVKAGDATKDVMAGTLERVCKILTGAGMDKLLEEDE